METGTPLSSLLGGALSLNLLETSPKKESDRPGTARERERERERDKYNTKVQRERGTRYLKHRKENHKEARRACGMSEQVRLLFWGGETSLPVFRVGTDWADAVQQPCSLDRRNDLLVCLFFSPQ